MSNFSIRTSEYLIMHLKIRGILIVAILFLISLPSISQVSDIVEDDIDFKLLKWHYSKYPKTTAMWKVLKVQGQPDVYQANFVFQSYQTIVLYTHEGEIIEEEVDLSSNVPVSILAYLDDFYLKYKVNSYVRITDFKSDSEVTYEMKIKSKERGVELIEFDSNLIPIDNDLVSRSN